MTLGKKLSNYRKMSGMTQQQLGEHLNLSAQAISKWENDLAEPDLTTLKALSLLYKVSIDELLSTEGAETVSTSAQFTQVADTDSIASSIADALDEKIKMNETPRTVGFCKECGIAVTEENLGKSEPIVMCKKCVRLQEERERAEEARKKREREAEQAKADAKKRATRESIRNTRKKSLIVASIVTAVFAVLLIASLKNSFSIEVLIGGLVLLYPIFALTAMFFYDSPVTDVILNMCSASIKWPGLIFAWSIDGFIWVICMKLLFAVIGFLFGLACSILGLLIGLLIAPFVFPYVMVKLSESIRTSTESDFTW